MGVLPLKMPRCRDRRSFVASLRLPLAILLLSLSANSFAADPSTAPSSPSTASSPSPSSQSTAAAQAGQSELESLLSPLAQAGADARKQAAQSVIQAGPALSSAVISKLAEVRRSPVAIGSAMRSAKEQLSEGKRADLLDVLAALPPDRSTAALTELCLLRALARTGGSTETRELVVAASDAGGVFRPELSRLFKGLGERGVAALIWAKRDPNRETRAWAASVLEGLGKRLPGDAVQTNDNQIVADVVRAYAGIKDLDALPVVLSFVNSERAQVRMAAREALASYGKDATWKLRESYQQLLGKSAPEGAGAEQLARELFEAYDKFRSRDAYALIDEGLARAKEGKLQEAVTSFDQALAREPLIDRRGELVPFYVEQARALESTNRPAALALLRKAIAIDPHGPLQPSIQSDIHFIEAEERRAQGIVDLELYREALKLAPDNDRARKQLAEFEQAESQKSTNKVRILVAGILFALGGAAAIFFGGRRRSHASG